MSTHLHILNGPNLNLLGKREPEIYGNQHFETYLEELKAAFPDITFTFFQSNVEGELINSLHEHGFTADGILLNAGGYTHTSVALGDAVAAIKSPVIEIHISNVFSREAFRQTSFISAKALGVISGFGLESYRLGVAAFMQHLSH